MITNKTKVLMADDHVLLRDALATLINSFDEFQVIQSVSSGDGLIKALDEGAMPDLVLLDLNMPILDGFETAKWLYKNHPDIKIGREELPRRPTPKEEGLAP